MNPLSSFGSLSFYSSFPSWSGYGRAASLQGSTLGGNLGSEALLSGRGASSSAQNIAGNRRVMGKDDLGTEECQTCKNRKYQDGSNDPGVSFKTPTKLSPEEAAYAVRAHEYEHVAHARAKAQASEDTEILSQTVTYHTEVCPECGRTFIAGGNTETVFRTTKNMEPEAIEKGRFIDVRA